MTRNAEPEASKPEGSLLSFYFLYLPNSLNVVEGGYLSY